ncbi:MAG: hypothetical protein JST67_00040 [Bacteroidetes bacterium]|nr:hypothetical protein [Bacteroidota bacterium]
MNDTNQNNGLLGVLNGNPVNVSVSMDTTSMLMLAGAVFIAVVAGILITKFL